MDTVARLIAFYLPQFHPIPENDEWWGKGFTEWRNVAQGRPLFPGHYQPHLPADLGFYDLRVPETREAQAEMAREHGIHGFCYYHYWFNGRRLLHQPLDEVLRLGRPRFPFCLCWANENWTRRWDGLDREILIGQSYSVEDDRAHVRHLLPVFGDSRYIRVEGRPLFLVYHTRKLPEPARTAEVWREEAVRAGIGDLYLVSVESHQGKHEPGPIGFDATVEFAPDPRGLGLPKFRQADYGLRARVYQRLQRHGMLSKAYAEHRVYGYDHLVREMSGKRWPDHAWFRCVTPSWDNSARRRQDALIMDGSTPDKYGDWLKAMIAETVRFAPEERQIVFVNAWNEWAEGNHLEPDLRWGRAYLQATRRAVLGPRVAAGSR